MTDEHLHVADITPPRRTIRQRIITITVIAVIIIVVRRSGLTDLLGDEARLSELMDDAGWFGPFLYLLAFTLLVPVGVPGLLFVLPATVIFDKPTAFAIVLAGGYTSSGIGVWFARTIGRDKVAARLPARFRRWDEAISRRGLLAVIALRTFTYLTAPADWLLGLSSISNRQLIVGTAVGLIPPTLLYVFVGGGLLDLVL